MNAPSDPTHPHWISDELTGCLDSPSRGQADDGPFVLAGWLFSCGREVHSVLLRHESGWSVTLEHGMPRPDVGAAYPLFPQAINSGFSSGEALLCPPGTTNLEVRASFSDGTEQTLFRITVSAATAVEAAASPRSDEGAEVLDLCKPKIWPMQRLEELGISPLYLQWLSTNVGIDESPNPPRQSPRSLPPADAEERIVFQRAHVREWSYLRDCVKRKSMLALDPRTGRSVRSRRSYSLDHDLIAYEYVEDEHFLLIVGGWRGERICLVLDGGKRVIALPIADKPVRSNQWLATDFLKLLDRAGVPRSKAEALRRPAATRLAIQLGYVGNLGHFLWQELAGLDAILREHGAAAIDALVVAPFAPVDPIELFPELANIRVERVARGYLVPSSPIAVDHQCLRPVHGRIPRGLVDRIIACARRVAGDAFIAKVDEFRRNRKVLWINLRAHNKVWSRQVPGYAHLVSELQKVGSPLGVVIDGFEDATEAAKALIDRLPPEVAVTNTIGCSIHQSIVWANAVDAYCSVVGSGLVINSWLARVPGVAHANLPHLWQEPFWTAACEGSVPPTFIAHDSLTQSSTLYGDYDFDETRVVPALASFLSKPR